MLAMKDGAMLLVDEISLADDSVLERLNSVLEPERTLLLAEKGGGALDAREDVDVLVAHHNFRIIGTMNPGGDFGKKEVCKEFGLHLLHVPSKWRNQMNFPKHIRRRCKTNSYSYPNFLTIPFLLSFDIMGNILRSGDTWLFHFRRRCHSNKIGN